MKTIPPASALTPDPRPIDPRQVLARLRYVADPEDRRALWHLHRLSQEPGGLEALCRGLLAMSERLQTPTMATVPNPDGGVYSEETAEIIDDEIRCSIPRTRAEIQAENRRAFVAVPDEDDAPTPRKTPAAERTRAYFQQCCLDRGEAYLPDLIRQSVSTHSDRQVTKYRNGRHFK